MSIARRLAQFFRRTSDKISDEGEDPREVLDYSYERQLEMLTKVRRGVADVTTSRKRLELQLNQLHQAADHLQAQATEAVDAEHDDLAREALARRVAVADQIADLTAQRDTLAAEELKLTTSATQLQARVEAFRTRKETIKASYTAAEAQTRISEAMIGISTEMGDIGLAVQRAEDKTVQMQARASAMDELLASGVLADATTLSGRSEVYAALEATRNNIDVETELAALKAGRSAPAISDKPPHRVAADSTTETEASA